MNKTIATIGSLLVVLSVILFAIFMLIPFNFGCYFICMILSIGYVMMTSGYYNESDKNHKVAAKVGMIFATVYMVLILLVYFAQTTAVRLDNLDEQAMKIIDYSRGGLFFSYDLLGYGMMSLSTFFLGITINTKNKVDKWLKCLMIIHGLFFFGCFIMPMTGVFSSMSNGETNVGGIIALEVWCAYFIPIGILSAIHFIRGNI
jgi:hypothetical protein